MKFYRFKLKLHSDILALLFLAINFGATFLSSACRTPYWCINSTDLARSLVMQVVHGLDGADILDGIRRSLTVGPLIGCIGSLFEWYTTSTLAFFKRFFPGNSLRHSSTVRVITQIHTFAAVSTFGIDPKHSISQWAIENLLTSPI